MASDLHAENAPIQPTATIFRALFVSEHAFFLIITPEMPNSQVGFAGDQLLELVVKQP